MEPRRWPSLHPVQLGFSFPGKRPSCLQACRLQGTYLKQMLAAPSQCSPWLAHKAGRDTRCWREPGSRTGLRGCQRSQLQAAAPIMMSQTDGTAFKARTLSGSSPSCSHKVRVEQEEHQVTTAKPLLVAPSLALDVCWPVLSSSSRNHLFNA